MVADGGSAHPYIPNTEGDRAIMLARANTLARGFSGIREELIKLLIVALNKNVLPEIPSEGSVGASGDLVPLAHMAGLLVGNGFVRLVRGL